MIYFKELFSKMQENLTVISDDDWGREELSIFKDDGDDFQIETNLEIEKKLEVGPAALIKKVGDL